MGFRGSSEPWWSHCMVEGSSHGKGICPNIWHWLFSQVNLCPATNLRSCHIWLAPLWTWYQKCFSDGQEEVYVKRLQRFMVQGKVFQLHKSLCDLKKSPHTWFAKSCQAIERFRCIKTNMITMSSISRPLYLLLLLVVCLDDTLLHGVTALSQDLST